MSSRALSDHQENAEEPLRADPTFLTAAEVAAVFRVTPRTLWNWERAGLLLPIRVSRRRLYQRADVDRLRCGQRS